MKIQCFALGAIGTNCYVISDDNGIAAVIDCDGSGHPLFKYIEENNLTPTHILLTHGHFDHIGAVQAVKQKYGCKVCAGALEADVLAQPQLNSSDAYGDGISIIPDELLTDGQIVTIGDLKFKVMNTPGHTEGSICFIQDKNIFSGDTLFLGSCGRTDFPTGDWSTIVHSLQQLKALEGDYVVYPGHGPTTTLDYERRTNPYM